MDILYILGKGSPFYNEELKYSLRSLECYGKNIGKIVLVGEKPSFLDYSKIDHYPFIETGVKEFRIAAKILYACKLGAVNGDFLFCNDDFFFTKDFDCDKFPYYSKGLLYTSQNNAYADHLRLTRDYLLSKGKPTYHFDVHCPIIYNSDKFMDLSDAWEFSRDSIGMVVKSTYANTYKIKGTFFNDIKLKALQSPTDMQLLKLNECFSIYDQAWNLGVKDYLESTFTSKSKWEL